MNIPIALEQAKSGKNEVMGVPRYNAYIESVKRVGQKTAFLFSVVVRKI